MKRWASITLTAVMVLIALSPLAASALAPQAALCCRVDGKHHCNAMGGAVSESDGPAFKASSQCPMRCCLTVPSTVKVVALQHVGSLRPDVKRLVHEALAPSIRSFFQQNTFQRGPPVA